MTKRVILVRQEDDHRRGRQETDNLRNIVESDDGEEKDKEDVEDTGDERGIWEVAHVTEEDFETTEGESQDLYDKLMEKAGWTVTDKQKENDWNGFFKFSV